MPRFRPRPFCTREAALGRTLGPHRVWVDNLPYDTTLADLTAAFASTWSGRPRPPLPAALWSQAGAGVAAPSRRRRYIDRSSPPRRCCADARRSTTRLV